jgi:hypothetical protein
MEQINKEKRQFITFLSWLEQRLIYKHGYDKNDNIIVSISKLIYFLQPTPYLVDISQSDLDKIISKYYADFTLDGSDDINFGYTESQRERLRDDIRHLVNDVVNKNIPKEFLLKDNN